MDWLDQFGIRSCWLCVSPAVLMQESISFLQHHRTMVNGICLQEAGCLGFDPSEIPLNSEHLLCEPAGGLAPQALHGHPAVLQVSMSYTCSLIQLPLLWFLL